MDLTCYVHEGWAPRIRPASSKREWMENTPERFAYRCLPLAIANAHGWEIASPCGFKARWNGGRGVEAVEIRVDAGTSSRHVPVSLFGHGALTFHVEGLIRTDPGWNLWVGGSPNAAKDGIAPLGGVIESDWAPYSFTMNWRFTRKNHWVRFEEDEAFCFFFPVQRGVLNDVRPVIRPLEDDPELQNAFKSWSASRDAFQRHVCKANPSAPADKWQKLYYRGVRPDGSDGPADHQSKVRTAPFVEQSAGQSRCPVNPMSQPSGQIRSTPAILAAPSKPAAPFGGPAVVDDMLAFTLRNIGFDAKVQPQATERRMIAPPPSLPQPLAAPKTAAVADIALSRREWILDTIERQRALAPGAEKIARVSGLSADDFLADYYAPSKPVVIEGAMEHWPARARWTPAYLKAAIGSAPIDYQGGRTGNAQFELQKDKHTRRMPFDRYIDAVTAGDGNDAYITAYNSTANAAALAPLHGDLGHLDQLLTSGEGMLWIGPAGTFTPLHFDLTNNLLAQVVGTKSLTLLPPSETAKLANTRHVFSDVHDIGDPASLARHPQARTARRFEVELGAGDLLYIPVGWWHQVRSTDFSVMLTYTNFRWRNDAYAAFPLE